MSNQSFPMIETIKLSRYFKDAGATLTIFHQVNLKINRGEQVAIMGRSGSGKTTLLQLLGGIDDPSSGQVFINGQDVHQLSNQMREKFRNKSLGFIYQFHYLLPEFTALENVAMPMLIGDASVKEALEKAELLLEQVGLKERMDHKPSALSGGERQRVAIARALVNNPECLFADEPTGNLDQENAEQIINLLVSLNKKTNTTLVIVTHDKTLADKMDRTFYLKNGMLF